MSDAKKKRDPDPDLDDLGSLVDDLPPLDGDAVDEADPEELADYLADFGEGAADADDEHVADLAAVEEAADELEDLEGTWADEITDAPRSDLDIEVEEEDEETAWSGSGAADTPDLDDDWFVDDEGGAVADDGGQEGPLDDELTEIDAADWDDLGDDLDDELEPVEDVMDRLGISFPEEEEADRRTGARTRVDRGVVLERQFLGPRGARIEAVAVDGGAVIGAGDGVFALGADGMLHQTPAEIPGYCASICICRTHAFVGTDRSGAFRLSDRGLIAQPINGWNTVWVEGRPMMGRVTTSFAVAGHPVGDEIRVLGITGEGQVFASTDLGQSWSGPLTDGKCLGAAVVEGTGEVIALVGGGGAASRLVASSDLESWRRLETPGPLAAVDQPGSVCLAAANGTLLAAVDAPGSPLHCSVDGGRTWSALTGVAGVTAVAVDPSGPGRIAAATYDSQQDLGLVRVSEDCGRSWQIAAVAGREPALGERSEHDGPRGRVTCLVVDVGRTRRLYVVAGEGAQRIVLSRGGLTQ